MTVLDRQTGGLSVQEFRENESPFCRERIEIGGDLVLRMICNSEVKLSRKLLELGMVKEPPSPLPRYHQINRGLVRAVSAGERGKIEERVDASKADVREMCIRVARNLGLTGRK